MIFNSNQVQIEELNGFLGGGKVSISGGAVLTDNLKLQAFRLRFGRRKRNAFLCRKIL